jgi:hypothetical protein
MGETAQQREWQEQEKQTDEVHFADDLRRPVRRLRSGEPEPQAPASGSSEHSSESSEGETF